MVLSFFKSSGGEGDFDHIVTKAVSMLSDARHSFDLATLALLTDADPSTVSDDVHSTDDRINHAEQELRSELIVHVAVQGTAGIGSVLGFTLLLKKIERIGDQAKNILELANHGVSFAEAANSDAMLDERRELSALFGEAAELLASADPDVEAIDEYSSRVQAVVDGYQAKIDDLMTSELPGNEAVPLAIYYRFLRRIGANLAGVVRVSIDPVPQMDYLEGGTVDTDD